MATLFDPSDPVMWQKQVSGTYQVVYSSATEQMNDMFLYSWGTDEEREKLPPVKAKDML